MSLISTENHPPSRSPNVTLHRLAPSRAEIILWSHWLQASLVVERINPLRRAVIEHPYLVRQVTVTIVILLSTAVGLLAP